MNTALKYMFLFHIAFQPALFSQHLNDMEAGARPLLKRIENAEDILQKFIFSALQDKQGYLWFGSANSGLFRYDGYGYTNFEYLSYDSTSLSHNGVHYLYQDSRNLIWVGLTEGLNCYLPEKNTFWRIKLPVDSFTQDIQPRVLTICEDKNGVIWIGSNKGLYRLILTERPAAKPALQMTHVYAEPALPHTERNTINTLHIDPDGNFWAGTLNGLGLIVNQQDGTFNPNAYTKPQLSFQILLMAPEEETDLQDAAFHYIRTLADGELWMMSKDMLFHLGKTSDRWRVEKFPMPGDGSGAGTFAGSNFIEVPDGSSSELWLPFIGHHHDILIFNRQNRSYRNLGDRRDHKSFKYRQKLIETSYNSLYRDRSGLIWIATKSGVFFYDPVKNRFSNYHPALLRIAAESPFNQRLAYLDSRGKIWIATEHLYQGDLQTGAFEQHRLIPDYGIDGWTFMNKMLEDRNGFLWFGSEDFGVYRYDPERKIVTDHYWHDLPNEILSQQDNVMSLCEDSEGHIWAGSQQTISSLDSNYAVYKKRSLLYQFVNGSKEIMTYPIANWGSLDDPAYIYTIAEGTDGLLWLGTQFGLVRFDRRSGKHVLYQHKAGERTGLSHNHIHTLLPDPQMPHRYLWIGSSGGGLSRLDQQTGEFLHYTLREGLPTNMVSSLLSDTNGNLWLGTRKGIVKLTLHPESREMTALRIYTQADGLNGEDYTFFYGQNAYKSKSGQLNFTSTKGFETFHGEDVDGLTDSATIVLHGLQVNYETALPGVSQLKEIVLPYHRNTLTFDMLSLHFRAPEKSQYQYLLDGYDADWIQNGTNRQAHYTGLPPGDYTFRFKAAPNDGIWNKSSANLRIRITPPWWKTGWAYLIYTILIGTILYSIRRYETNRQQLRHDLELESLRTDQERQEAERLKEVDRLKTRFFTNISHEFRTPLTLIMGPVDQLLGQKKAEPCHTELNIVQRNARRLSHLINQLLDLSRLESHRLPMKAAPGDIAGFIKGLTKGFASWADRKNVTLEVIIGEGVENLHKSNKPLYFDRDFIEKMINNLISNALKFTPDGGKVVVKLAMASNERVKISVADNGIGIPANRLPHIFDRFYQADSSTTREHEGSGIGLTLCKDLTERHYGKIMVESAEGSGTVFTILLPLGNAHLSPEEMIPASPATESEKPASQDFLSAEFSSETPDSKSEARRAEKNEERKRTKSEERKPLSVGHEPSTVLLVEDHRDFRTYMRSCLQPDAEKAGGGVYRIVEAKNGEIGWEKALEVLPDIIISDIMMPKMNGYELCQKLKSDERTSHIPVILLTAKATQEDKLLGLETGADDYLSKPFDSRELNLRVRNMIAQRQKLQARFTQSIPLKPAEATVNSLDEAFLKKAIAVVEEHLADETLDVDTMQDKLHMSRTNLHRKLKALTGKSTTEFIRTVRLHRAADLLRQKAGTVTEIAFQTGFNSHTYFSRSFQKAFGMSPTAFAKKG